MLEQTLEPWGARVWAASAWPIRRQLRDTRAPVPPSVAVCLVVEAVDLVAFEDGVTLRSTEILMLIPVCSLSAHPQGVLSVSYSSLSLGLGAGLLADSIYSSAEFSMSWGGEGPGQWSSEPRACGTG